MIYPISFLTSASLCACGEKMMKKQSKRWLSLFCFFLSVLTLIIIAGCRDKTIGTDLRYYVDPSFSSAKRYTNLFAYMKEFISIYEPLYISLVYFVTRFTKSSQWLYAAIGAIIYVCFFCGLYRYKKAGYVDSITLGWIYFILIFFSSSLNLMRQMMAMSVLFLGSIYIVEEKYAKYVPYCVVAILFHQTAICGFVALILYVMLPRKNSLLYIAITVVAVLVISSNYNVILSLFMRYGIFAEKYTRYSAADTKMRFLINPFIQRIVPLLVLLPLGKYEDENDRKYGKFFSVMLVLDMLLVQLRSLGNILSALSRVALYFSIYVPVAYPFFSMKIGKQRNRLFTNTFLLIFFSAIWWYQNVLQGGNEIYPYTSAILGIGL